jgi:hypothetical protein
MNNNRTGNWMSYADTAMEAAEAAVKAATTSASPTACIGLGRC